MNSEFFPSQQETNTFRLSCAQIRTTLSESVLIRIRIFVPPTEYALVGHSLMSLVFAEGHLARILLPEASWVQWS